MRAARPELKLGFTGGCSGVISRITLTVCAARPIGGFSRARMKRKEEKDMSKTGKIVRAALCAAAVFACGHSPAQGVKYDHRFNPLAGKITNAEEGMRSEICLNGRWDFMPVYKNSKADFALPAEFKADEVKIKIPSPWNVNRFAKDRRAPGGDFLAYPSYPKKWEDAKIGWMRRSVDIPASWKGRRAILRFDGVLGNCEVYVNGRKAMENFDLFMPFEADITDMLKIGGKNEILVGVAKAELYNENGKNGRMPYMGGSFWGEHVSGIWQDVWLFSYPEVYVKDIFAKPDLKGDTLTLEVEIMNASKSAKTVNAKADARRWINLAGRSVADAPVEKGIYDSAPSLRFEPRQGVSIPASSSKKVEFKARVAGKLDAWTPDSPNLYGAVVTLDGASKDAKSQRFGWRQFSIEGKDLFLNGKKFSLKGDSWHFMGVPQMTRRYAWGLFNMMKDANINAVRFHAQPYPSFYMDLADEMGVCVLDESAIWASGGGPKYDSEDYWKRADDHVKRLVMRDRNHPSVFGWSVCNEVFAVGLHVFKSPQEIIDRLVAEMNGWTRTVRALDPTRDWISGDGETNLPTELPTKMGHYADIKNLSKSQVPWGVGEQTMAYYGTPKQASKFNGERAYESMQGRMEAIAIEAYGSLRQQRELGAAYASVFNTVWYGLKPMPLGLADTSKKPTPQDGVFFPEFVEGVPGMQPERLGPYTTTLNPGYDLSLPLYEPWPMFFAVRAANSDPIADFEIERAAADWKAQPFAPGATALFASQNSELAMQLKEAGLDAGRPPASLKNAVAIFDGSKEIEDFGAFKKAARDGARIVVLGLSPESAEQLNSVLPYKIALSPRKATSFVKTADAPLLAGLNNSDFYFTELLNDDPERTMMKYGIGGDFAKMATVLLSACPADWSRWNKKSEYAKTAAVLRSEREENGEPAAIAELKIGKADIIISSLDFSPLKQETLPLVARMLENAGAKFSQSNADAARALDASGRLVKARSLKNNGDFGTVENPDGKIKVPGDVREVDFWVYSPRSLVDLLSEPNMPTLDLASKNAIKLRLNGADAAPQKLCLDKGWNRITIVFEGDGASSRDLEAAFECKNHPEYLKELLSSNISRR